MTDTEPETADGVSGAGVSGAGVSGAGVSGARVSGARVSSPGEGGPPASPRLVVKVTCGAESPERLSQAVTVAATALASGAEVSLWLTGDATWLATPGRAEGFVLPHAAPLADLRDALLAGASVTVCSQCAARRELTESDLLPGARIAGAASFVEEVLGEGVQALVY